MTKEINHDSSTPLHLQAEKILRELIREDRYARGEFLPTEVESER